MFLCYTGAFLGQNQLLSPKSNDARLISCDGLFLGHRVALEKVGGNQRKIICQQRVHRDPPQIAQTQIGFKGAVCPALLKSLQSAHGNVQVVCQL